MKLVRKLAALALRGLLIAIILLETGYLLRRALLEPLLRGLLERELATALQADVRVGRIAGNWITDLGIERLSVRDGEGVVRRLEGRQIAVRVAILPLLLDGDLAGIEQLELSARALDLDLTATPPADADRDEAPARVDASALCRLLPAGARARIDSLRVVGPGGSFAGPCDLGIAAGAPTDELRALAEFGGARLTALLRPDGSCRAELDAQDPGRLVGLFTDGAELSGGRAYATATARLPPELSLHASASAVGLRLDDRPVHRAALRIDLDDRGLRNGRVELAADGANLLVEDFALPLDAGEVELDLATGRARVLVSDFGPFEDLLPGDVRALAPLRARLVAGLARGRLEIDRAFLATEALTVESTRGAVALEPAAGDVGSLEITARIVDAARLPIPPDAAVRPSRGELHGRIASRRGGYDGSVELDLELIGPEGRPLRAQGPVAFEFRPADGLRLEPSLVVLGTVLDEPERFELAGAARVVGSRVSVDQLELRSPTRGTVAVSGALDVGEPDLERLARGAAVELELEALEIGPFCSWLGLDYAGRLALSSRWDGASPNPLSLSATGSVTGLLRDRAVPTALALSIVSDANGTRVDELSIQNPSLEIRGSAAAAGLAPFDLWARDDRALQRDLDARLTVSGKGLEQLDLEPFGSWAAAGDVAVRATAGGTVGTPAPAVELELTGLTLSSAGEPIVDGISGLAAAAIDDDGLELREVRAAFADGGRIELAGRLGESSLLAALRSDSQIDVRLEDVSLGPWFARADQPDLGGRLSATLAWRADGRPTADCSVEATVTGLTDAADAGEITTAFVLNATADALACEQLSLALAGARRLSGSAKLSDFGLARLLDEPAAIVDVALDARLDLDEFDLGVLDARAIGLGDLGGRVTGRAQVGGTIAAPEPLLTVAIAGGTLRPRGATRITGIEGQIEVTENAVRTSGLRAELGASPVRIDATFTAPGPLDAHWRDGRLDARVVGTDALLHRGRGVKVRGDLDITARGRLDELVIAGEVALASTKFVSRIPLVTLDRAGGESATQGIVLPRVALGGDIDPTLDIRLTTREPVQIATNVFQGGIALSMSLVGTLSAPVVAGTASGVDGVLILPGCRLRASTMLLTFERENPRFPEILINANGRRHGIDVQLNVRGRYDAPEVLLSSVPPLETEELVVLVTTGARPETLRESGMRGTAGLVGSYLVDEIADQLFGSDSTEDRESFLDRLTFEAGTEIGSNGTESILVEFRVLDRVYLQGERDIYEDINLGVVYRVRFK